jgi:hypothetical protein
MSAPCICDVSPWRRADGNAHGNAHGKVCRCFAARRVLGI